MIVPLTRVTTKYIYIYIDTKKIYTKVHPLTYNFYVDSYTCNSARSTTSISFPLTYNLIRFVSCYHVTCNSARSTITISFTQAPKLGKLSYLDQKSIHVRSKQQQIYPNPRFFNLFFSKNSPNPHQFIQIEQQIS